MQRLRQMVLVGFGPTLSLAPCLDRSSMSADLPERDVYALFAAAGASGRVGIARKSKPVDARPAHPGEVIITHIKAKGESEETRSKPADHGGRVVRNRCSTTGNEEYFVKAAAFAERYEGPLSTANHEG